MAVPDPDQQRVTAAANLLGRPPRSDYSSHLVERTRLAKDSPAPNYGLRLVANRRSISAVYGPTSTTVTPFDWVVTAFIKRPGRSNLEGSTWARSKKMETRPLGPWYTSWRTLTWPRMLVFALISRKPCPDGIWSGGNPSRVARRRRLSSGVMIGKLLRGGSKSAAETDGLYRTEVNS